MGLEDLTGGSKFIDDLVNTNPAAGDQKSEGDDHIRGVKNVLLNTFPNITGAVTATQSELNNGYKAIPQATLMLFQQTAAPTGWTKQTTHNDKALRIVSGTASSGGTDAYSTCFSASKATDSYTLLEADIPSHTHVLAHASASTNLLSGTEYLQRQGSIQGAGDDEYQLTGTTNTPDVGKVAETGGGGGHAHDITIDLQYVDVIIASKD